MVVRLADMPCNPVGVPPECCGSCHGEHDLVCGPRTRASAYRDGTRGSAEHGGRPGLAVDQPCETSGACAVTHDGEKEKAVQDRQLPL